MSPGPRPASLPSGILINPANWPQQTWAENGWGLSPFGGELGLHLTQMSLGRRQPSYQVASWAIQPFARNRHGPKSGWLCPFLGGGWGPIQHSVACAAVYLRTKWHLDQSSRLATTDKGRKLGAVPPFWGWGTGSPPSTMWPGLMPTSMPSATLIHPAVWSQ